MWGNSIQYFGIQLQKDFFLAGEVVSGVVSLHTVQPIQCRGVRLKLKGAASCRFWTGSGDDRELRTNHKRYLQESHTIWGQYYRTDVIDNAGSDAHFGSPWSPNEGVMYVFVPPNASHICLQVIDEDWGKRDDILGENLVDIRQAVQASMNGPFALNLLRNGKPEKGQVSLHVSWVAPDKVPIPGSYGVGERLRVEIKSATGLRKADWFGKNDVYVQCYLPPGGVVPAPGQALPGPDTSAVLPPGRHDIPFQLQLSSDLPASFEGYCSAIRYSVYAHIDIKWSMDPSTRRFISVSPVLPSSWPTLAKGTSADADKTIFPVCCIPPCCCDPCKFEVTCCGEKGRARLLGSIERLGYSPGEVIACGTTAHNEGEQPCKLKVYLKREERAFAEGRADHSDMEIPLFEGPVSVGENQSLSHQFVMPPLPASYNGGLGHSRYPDPVVWRYLLVIELDIPGTPFDLEHAFPIVVTSIPVAVPFQYPPQLPAGCQQTQLEGVVPLPMSTAQFCSPQQVMQQHPLQLAPAGNWYGDVSGMLPLMDTEQEDRNSMSPQAFQWAPAYPTTPNPPPAQAAVPPAGPATAYGAFQPVGAQPSLTAPPGVEMTGAPAPNYPPAPNYA